MKIHYWIRAIILDPDADIIEIPNPIIHPDALYLLSIMLNKHIIPSYVNSNIKDINFRNKLENAYRYLGIDILCIIIHRKYTTLLEEHWYKDINLVDVNSLKNEDVYAHLLEFAIEENWPDLLNYVMTRVNIHDVDEQYFRSALNTSQINLVKPFIRKGLDINKQYGRWTPLQISIGNNYIDLAKYLLSLPQINPSFKDFLMASDKLNIDIINKLLECPSIDPSSYNNMALVTALMYSHIDIAKRLYSDPRVYSTFDISIRHHYCHAIDWDEVERNYPLLF